MPQKKIQDGNAFPSTRNTCTRRKTTRVERRKQGRKREGGKLTRRDLMIHAKVQEGYILPFASAHLQVVTGGPPCHA